MYLYFKINSYKDLIMNLINQMLSKLLIIHDIFKNFILYISALILELNNWLLNLYSLLENFINLYSTLFVNYSFLKFLSFLGFFHHLYLDVFSFDHTVLKTYFLLLLVVIVVIGNALNYNKFLLEKTLEFLFLLCYLYVTVLIFSILFLILLHLKAVSWIIWCMFLQDYHNSLAYKLLANVVVIYLFRYYLVDVATKKHYLLCFFILLFGWFANYFVYQNFKIILSSKIDPIVDLLVSLSLNWLLYEFIYHFIDKTDPEVIKTYQKWNKWLNSLASNSFVEKFPLKWFIFVWFITTYVCLILMSLI